MNGVQHDSELQRLIRRSLAEKDLTYRAAEARSGLSKSTIANLANGRTGRTQAPHRRTLELLARALDVPLSQVLAAARSSQYPDLPDGVLAPDDLQRDLTAIREAFEAMPHEDRLIVVHLAQGLAAQRSAPRAVPPT